MMMAAKASLRQPGLLIRDVTAMDMSIVPYTRLHDMPSNPYALCHMGDLHRRHIFAFVGIVAAAAFLRCYAIGTLSFWTDEVASYMTAKGPVSQIIRWDYNMILFHALAHVWIRIIPHVSEATLRTLPSMFSLVMVVSVFFLARAVDRDPVTRTHTGLMASALVAFNAFDIRFAQEFRGYSLLSLLLVASTITLLKASDADRNHAWAWWAVYASTGIAAIHTHTLAALPIAVHAIYVFTRNQANRQHRLVLHPVVAYSAIAIGAVPILPAIASGVRQIWWLTPPTVPTVMSFVRAVTGGYGTLLTLLFVTASLAALFRGFRVARDERNALPGVLLVAGLALVPPAIAILLSFVLFPIFHERYFIASVPFLSVIAAYGVTGLPASAPIGPARRVAEATAVVFAGTMIVLSYLGILGQFSSYRKEEWRFAARLLSRECSGPTSLRLFYREFLEDNAVFYDPALASTIAGWRDAPDDNIRSHILAEAVKSRTFTETCLVSSHVFTRADYDRRSSFNATIESAFPNCRETAFYRILVRVCR